MFKKVTFVICVSIFIITFVYQTSNMNKKTGADINDNTSSTMSSFSEPSNDISSDLIETSSIDTSSMENPTPTLVSSSQVEKVICYEITANERKLIEEVVMAESGTEDYQGQCAIAQCILDACKLEGKRPAVIIKEYQYTKYRKTPSKSVKDAVSAVFDDGYRVTEEETLYFYAPAICTSKWHESMNFVIQIGNVRFFN